jgi:hypothetical protein
MKLELSDSKNRVFRFLHRSTPGGELVIMDLRFGYRGEIFCVGCDEHNFIEVRCFSQHARRWDPVDDRSLIQIRWPLQVRRVALHRWSKGTLELLLCPLHTWMPSASKKWTCLKEMT